MQPLRKRAFQHNALVGRRQGLGSQPDQPLQPRPLRHSIDRLLDAPMTMMKDDILDAEGFGIKHAGQPLHRMQDAGLTGFHE